MKIRRARPDEWSRLNEIAQAAARHWGYPEHWVSHYQDDLTVSTDSIANERVFVAEVNGELCGFYTLVANSPGPKLDQLWISPDHIGSGVGKELFLHARERQPTQ
jgi:hypothetical protein